VYPFSAVLPCGLGCSPRFGDGILDCFGVGGLLLAELGQEFVGGPQDLNHVRHSFGPATGAGDKRYARIGTALQASECGTHSVIIDQVLDLLQ